MKEDKKAFYPGFGEPEEFLVSAQPKSVVYRIEIDDEISSVRQFSTAIRVLGLAKEDDLIEIYLQTNGGNVDASGAFVHAMGKCEAHIHCVATGGVHSAGTHILLEADSFELSHNFNCLLHNGSSGAGGNINEYAAKAKFDANFLDNQYWGIYEGFLSLEEFRGMMRGDNIWLDAEEFCKRYTARFEHFKAKAEEMQANVTRLENELAESSKFTPAVKAKLTKPAPKPRKKAVSK